MLAGAGISNSRMDRAKLKAKSIEDLKGNQQMVKDNANAVAHIIDTMQAKRKEVASRQGAKSMASRRGLNRPTVSFAMPTRDDLEVMVIAEQSE